MDLPLKKSSHIQRSVRAGSNARGYGDAPGIGAVRRMPRSEHKAGMVRKVRKRGERDEFAKRDDSKMSHRAKMNRRIVVITSTIALIVVCLAVFGILFALWVNNRHDIARQEGSRHTAERALEEKLLATKYTPPSPVEAEELVRRVVFAESPEQLGGLVRTSTWSNAKIWQLLAPMRERGLDRTEVTWCANCLVDDLQYVMCSVDEEGSVTMDRKYVCLSPREDGTWWFDADASFARCEPEWSHILQQDVDESRVRVMVAKDVYYFGDYSDDAKWSAYQLMAKDLDEAEVSLTGYCKRGSQIDEKLKEFIESKQASIEDMVDLPAVLGKDVQVSKRVFLKIGKVSGNKNMQTEILEILSADWVRR